MCSGLLPKKKVRQKVKLKHQYQTKIYRHVRNFMVKYIMCLGMVTNYRLSNFFFGAFIDNRSFEEIGSLPVAQGTAIQVVQSGDSPNYQYQPTYENIGVNLTSSSSSAEIGVSRGAGSGDLTSGGTQPTSGQTNKTKGCSGACVSASGCFIEEFRSKSHPYLKLIFIYLPKCLHRFPKGIILQACAGTRRLR